MIHHFDFDVDREKLLAECKSVEMTHFTDPKSGTVIDYLGINAVDRTKPSYAVEVSNYWRKFFNLPKDDAQPIFYIQKIGLTFPFHVDRNTQASINILLEDNSSESDPISFRVEEHYDNLRKIDSDIDEYYKIALINVQQEHGVISPKYERHLYKCSIKSKTYDECVDILKNKL